MMDSGPHGLSYKQVRGLRPEKPKGAGRLWTGVPHARVIGIIDEYAERTGLVLTNGQYSVSGERDGNRGELAASWRVGGVIVPPPGLTLSLGVRTSNNRNMKLRLYVGVVDPQGRGYPLFRVVMPSRKTIRQDFDTTLALMVNQWVVSKLALVPSLVGKLRGKPFTTKDMDALLTQIGGMNRKGKNPVMTWSRIGGVFSRWRYGPVDENYHGTMWGAYQTFSTVARENPPREQMEQLYQFYLLLNPTRKIERPG